MRSTIAPRFDFRREAQDVGARVVERGGGDADDVGFAPVAQHAARGEELEEVAARVADIARSGDLVITLGAGSIGGLANALVDELQRRTS